MAIIPVERRFTSGISTLKWHTRWSKDEKGADDAEEETGDEAKNWASGFIVFKVWFYNMVILKIISMKTVFYEISLKKTFSARTFWNCIFRMANKKLILKFHWLTRYQRNVHFVGFTFQMEKQVKKLPRLKCNLLKIDVGWPVLKWT